MMAEEIVCDGNCLKCPYPDVPDQCLDKPLSASELRTAVSIDLQSVKHSVLDPETKLRKINEISERARVGRVAGIKKTKPNKYPESVKRNRADYGEIHSLIRAARESRGWTLRELAGTLGVSHQLIHHWEVGNQTARWDLLVPVMPELADVAIQAEELYKNVSEVRIQEKRHGKNQQWKASDVKTERLRKNMTAKDVAEALGVSKGTVINWECGRTKPNWRLLSTIFPRFRAEASAKERRYER